MPRRWLVSTRKASGTTDNPATGTAGDGTAFVLAQGVLVAPTIIPTTSLPINLLLSVLLALIAFAGLRRRVG